MTYQPYQNAAQETKRQSELPLKLLKQGARLGGYAIGGGSIIARLLPLLSHLVPEDIAKKGIAKIDNRMGKFINDADKNGVPFEQTREFIREKIEPDAQELSAEEQSEMSRVETLQKFNQRQRKQPSELSRESLMNQFQQGQESQQSPGKAALLGTMQQITEQLRRMRGNG